MFLSYKVLFYESLYMSKKILIIGSGIAGISSSLKLKSYGLEATIIDKGDFIGGRIGTRDVKIKNKSHYFFHGAQFFTAKSYNFNKIIRDGLNKKYIKEYGSFSPPRYRGFESMRNFLINLSQNLNIIQNVKVTHLEPCNDKISVLDNKSSIWKTYDAVISTIPAPQNLDLVKKFPTLKKTLMTASYDACVALMFFFDENPKNVPHFFDYYNKKGILSWMAAGSSLRFWTAHAQAAFSNKSLNKDRILVKNEIFSEIKKIIYEFEENIKINFHSLQIWKYAKVMKVASGPQIDPKFPIAIAGDFMEGPNIESAFISGEKAADLIFKRLH